MSRTPPTPATDAPAFNDHGCIYCRAQGSDCEGPHRFAADEREALGATVSAFWDTKDTVESCINAVLSALAPYRAAEILAAEANERARIVALVRQHAKSQRLDGLRCVLELSANAIEHGAGK